MVKEPLCLHCVLFLALLLAPEVCSNKAHGNPAKEIVDILNRNRTAAKLPALYDNPGLGCIALRYSEQCKINCTSNNTVNCQILEDDFTEVFAPDCGVELPTFDIITGVITGCRSKYLNPLEAFSEVLVRDKKSLSLIRNKTSAEVGVGVASSKHHFFWCVLFSSGQKNSTFVLEDHGLGIKQKEGCFSGTGATCSLAISSMKGGMEVVGLLSFLSLYLLHLILNAAI